MAQVSISLRLAQPISGMFSEILEVLDHPFSGQRGRDAIALLRKSVRKEFAAGAWSRPEGGTSSWKTVLPFGIRPAPPTPLGGTAGFLSAAWQGGQYGFQEKSDTKVAIGVTHDAAPVHRGGDPDPSESYVTIIPITEQMRKRVGYEFKTGFPREQTQIEIPARPHATTNPELEADLVQAFGRLIAVAAGTPQ